MTRSKNHLPDISEQLALLRSVFETTRNLTQKQYLTLLPCFQLTWWTSYPPPGLKSINEGVFPMQRSSQYFFISEHFILPRFNEGNSAGNLRICEREIRTIISYCRFFYIRPAIIVVSCRLMVTVDFQNTFIIYEVQMKTIMYVCVR